jgi:hypothetical protein
MDAPLKTARSLCLTFLLVATACGPKESATHDGGGGTGGATGGGMGTGGISSSGGSGGGPTGGRNGTGGAVGSGGTFGAQGGGGGSGGQGIETGGVTGSGGAAGSGRGGGTGSGGMPNTGGSAGGPSSSGGTSGTTGTGGGGAGSGGAGGGAGITSFAVVTDRYDNLRSGANMAETQLTTSNVNTNQFGLLFARAVTGVVYGQPLYAGGIAVGGVKHNVVYVATAHDMLYAFDADSPSASAPLWSRSLGPALTIGAGQSYDPGCNDMSADNQVGITSTPVISLADNAIYVVAKTNTSQQLHELDLGTGDDVAGSPSTIGAGPMTFDPRIHLNRPGLLLLNGIIYIAYGSHCDAGSYHGWILGYDAKTLQNVSVYNTTPTGSQGAIWQSGTGLSTDGTDIWVAVGNGSTNGNNVGFSAVRLTPNAGSMTIAARYQASADGDDDLQGGATILGTTGQIVAGNKNGNIFLLGQSDLSLKQKLQPAGSPNLFAFWNGSAGPLLFAWPEGSGLIAYQVGAGSLTQKGTNTEQKPNHPGGSFTVSSNGATAGTGIVWATMPVFGDAWHGTATGALYAFDASNVAKASLWNSNLTSADTLGTYAKYSPPMVANGKVYVATFSGELRVYGLK